MPRSDLTRAAVRSAPLTPPLRSVSLAFQSIDEMYGRQAPRMAWQLAMMTTL